MKKVYLQPWLRVVEIDESDIVCTSPQFKVELRDYDTYEDTPRSETLEGGWNGVGTGSDF